MLFPSLLYALTKTESMRKGMNRKNIDVGKETAKTLAKEARKNHELILSSSGTVKSKKPDNFASVCSKRGKKGINQDCLIVWEVYMSQRTYLMQLISLICSLISDLFVWLLGVWMPRRHDVLWHFRWAWPMGAPCIQKGEEISACFFAMQLARNSSFNLA